MEDNNFYSQMPNDIYLRHMQNSYGSLKAFSIINDRLILHLEIDYIIPFKYTNLSSLNPNLFLMAPKEILYILYMLELLAKKELDDNEKGFVRDYTKKYLKLSDDLIENNKEDNLLWGYSIPIYTCYDELYINNPSSIIIQDLINKHTEEIESSRGNHQKLVLTNPNFVINQEEDMLPFLEKAGFTTLFLITGAVCATCVYIIYFVLSK